MKPEETKDRILRIRHKTESWESHGERFYNKELVFYTVGFHMQFPFDHEALPKDIETNYKDYLLCVKHFEPGKPMSKTGVTSVWFEKVQPNNKANLADS